MRYIPQHPQIIKVGLFSDAASRNRNQGEKVRFIAPCSRDGLLHSSQLVEEFTSMLTSGCFFLTQRRSLNMFGAWQDIQ